MKSYDRLETQALLNKKRELNIYLNLVIAGFFLKVFIIYYIEIIFGTTAAAIAVFVVLFIIYKLLVLIDNKKKMIEKSLKQRKNNVR